MQPNEFEAFAKQMMVVGELYKTPVSELLAELYWTSLEGYEFADIKRAIKQHINNADQGRFMPKPADLVKIIDGSGQAKAQLAWSKVAKAIARIGHYKTVVFDDPLIHRVIDDMDGWCRLCMVTDKELPFKAREFEQRYTSYLLKPPMEYPKQLSGYTEQHNSAHSFPEHVKLPLAVGNQQKAQAVLENGSEATTIYQVLEAFGIPKISQALPALETSELMAIEARAAKPGYAELQVEDTRDAFMSENAASDRRLSHEH